jgi:phospholipid/cholesterol/gamma-HCH transport system substrate-binding protein
LVSKAAKIRLGVFVVCGILLLVLFFGLVIGNRLVEKKDTYYIRFKDYSVYGLQVGAAVYYNGIHIGSVSKASIDPRDVANVILTLSVDQGTPIKEDSEAILIYVGITGTKAVEIRGGTNPARTLDPGSYVQAGSTQLEEISGRAGSIIEKVEQIAANLATMTGGENSQTLGVTLENLNRVAVHSDTLIVSTTRQIEDISLKLNASLDRINQMLYSAEGDSLIANVNSLTAQLSQTDIKGTVDELSGAINELRRLITNIDRTLVRNQVNLDDTLESLREASENLNEFSRQISEQPSILLRNN